MVDVTHDGDDRRAGHQVVVALGLALGVEVDVELLEQLALLVLRGDDLDLVAELGAEETEGVLVERLRRGGHLTEVEQHRDERRRAGVDLVGEVGQRRATAHPHDLRAVPTGDLHATDRRRLHLLELLALRPLGLAPTDRTATTAAERTGRGATAAATRTATAAGTTAEAATAATAAGTTGATGRTRTTAGTTRTGAGTADRGAVGHHPGVGTRTSGTRAGRAGAAGTRTGCAGASWAGLRTGHALARGEGVVARTRRALAGGRRAAHALARGERVVAGPGLTARTRGRTRCATGRAGATRSTRTAGLTGGDARSRGTRTRSGRSRRRGGRPGRGRRGGSGRRLDRGLRRGAGAGAAGAGGRGSARTGAGAGADGAGADGAGPTAPTGAAVFAAVWAPFPLPFPLAAPRSSAGNDSLMVRTTGGSMVDDADRTNSPLSLRYVRSVLLSTPSSLASS